MKVSYQWLKEFVAIEDDAQAVADRLSLAGLEVASVEPAVPGLQGLVIGEVLSVEKHPDADKLRVCRVSTGDAEHQIVCGAPNVRAGMKAPVILPGGQMPDGTKIRKAKLRGVESNGLLCSARELGLSDDHSGLMDLPADAPAGAEFSEYLGSNDAVITIEITPNRGDCLGVLGVARDVSALYDLDLVEPVVAPIPARIDDSVEVTLEADDACPVFLGRVIRNVNPEAETPLWMRERLRRSGIRPVSPLVDITQYVMFELGQPMHAYDLREIRGGVRVRWARPGEELTLLDGSKAALDEDILVIADHERVLGVAGIMGGEGSGVRDDTRDVYLECAWFAPEAINGRPRRLGLHTDAGYRFERGVDPAIQRRAIERATALMLEIIGGEAGPVVETRDSGRLPQRKEILLRRSRLGSLLGIDVPSDRVSSILTRLGMPPRETEDGWRVDAPSHRFDIEIEEDLIEEVGRIYGYEHIAPAQYPATRPMEPVSERQVPVRRLREAIADRGYQEVVTYSFVPADLQQHFYGEPGLPLANPITTDMTHMRMGLWPGLVQVLQYNLNRQQTRVRIFECGLKFLLQDHGISQENVIGGLACGTAYAEQWGLPERELEFADVKGDLEALLESAAGLAAYRFEPATHPALHPGQSARITKGELQVGWLGLLHPNLARELTLPRNTYVFELSVAALQSKPLPVLQALSRFPAIRRDLAVIVDEKLLAQTILDHVRAAAGDVLRNVEIFDIYRGTAVDSGRKSVALSLILQDSSRTLVDDDVDALMQRVASRLQESLGAQLRE